MRRTTRLALVCCLVVGLAGCAGVGSTPTATDTQAPVTADATTTATPTATPEPVATPGSDYDTATVTISAENGTQVATVEAWVADDFGKRYTGLSETEALEPGQGMLFVHGQEGNHAYVMRNMDFPLDMVFIAENGTITTIHHAPLESDDDDLTQYSGRSKYVLEVPYGYTNETGVEVGDRVDIDR
ncbi:hypothetical protein SAMN04488065_2315 [Haloplanus vescus]|uniref:DUF192 domain-containing protein n=1 Tax=Haloplanus vescus TaxID=555874 RepID=A0A1H3ZE59_9EURY|nr:DUF192 domain-containing protein [Haloplanus vescus]SEA22026.1 hypothetical protein SAMN04488065_2315 [Haloplanus vescus]